MDVLAWRVKALLDRRLRLVDDVFAVTTQDLIDLALDMGDYVDVDWVRLRPHSVAQRSAIQKQLLRGTSFPR